MKVLPRFAILAALGWCGFILFKQAHVLQATEGADQTKLMLYFSGVILVALAGGTFIALSVAPAVGEWIGNFFANPSEEIEQDSHHDARAKIAQGDYENAVEILLGIFAQDPSDMLALGEAARLCAEKLGDPDRAAGLLEEALQHGWPPEESAFFVNRLVDIYWNHRGDAGSAGALLAQIVETMPGTKFSANAQHRLHEIEQAVARGELPAPVSPMALDAEAEG